MIYLRNISREHQWLEDPHTGIRRRIDPDGLAPASRELVARALERDPDKWALVLPISPPPPGTLES